jgi:hypothetical protein
MRQNEISHRAIRALTYLLELVAREAGYLVHGVRGWATAWAVEEEMSTWSSSELMGGQAACGRATRADVRAPGDAKAVWAYRITQKGIDAVAAAVGTSPAGIDPPGGEKGSAVYIRDGAWVALCALRSVVESPPKWEKIWIVGESGWQSSRQLTRLVELEDEKDGLSPGRSFFSEDLAWLARVGYAERRVIEKTHIYRVTPTGAAAQRLDWKEPGDA